MKQFLKKIYNEGKVEKLEDKEEEKTWFSTLYDYVFGDDSEEEEGSQKTEEVDDSKLYNEVEQEETSNNEKIEKTLRK